jgi:hypothetical protein
MKSKMNKEILNKIRDCKALQNVTVEELCQSVRFRDNLAAYMTAQCEDRKAIRASYDAMRKLGGAKGFKIPAHPIDDLMSLSVDDFAVEYLNVISKCSKRPAAERQYILQLGQQAYNLTVAQIVINEFPELESVLIPKNKQN